MGRGGPDCEAPGNSLLCKREPGPYPGAFTEPEPPWGTCPGSLPSPKRVGSWWEFARGHPGHCTVRPSCPERLFSPPKDFGLRAPKRGVATH